MSKLGWRLLPESTAAYCIPFSYALSGFDERVYESLLLAYQKQIQKNDGKKFTKNILHSLLIQICEKHRLFLTKERSDQIEKIALMEIEGFGILDLLLKDDSLEELGIVGADQPIKVFKRGRGWLNTNCCFRSRDYAINLINKMARPLGRRITYSRPQLNAQLPDGSRLHSTISPLNSDFEITIRKFSASPLSIIDLIKCQTLSTEAAAFLWLAAFADTSTIIAGNTGSGKTTLANALFSFIPLDERVIIIEETPEIRIPHKHRIRLIANRELKISMEELVHNSLRMRPDRVMMGEVRTPAEAKALFDSLQAGQAKGSFATFHSEDSVELVNRLRGMGISKEDLGAVDLVIIMRRISVYNKAKKSKSEIRRVMEISEISENGAPFILFSMDSKTRKLKPIRKNLSKSSLLEKISLNYQSNRREIIKEIERRKKVLERMLPANHSHQQFTQEIQKEMFAGL